VPSSNQRKQSHTPAAPSSPAGLCFRFLVYDAETRDHTTEIVLCFRCQHSLAWGCDAAKQPRKAIVPGRRKDDPPVVLDPVARPCEWCVAFGLTPVYEADVLAQRRRQHEAELANRAALSTSSGPTPPRVDEDGQVNLF
jgi:hypothetical protein